jgi:hypothetical protein
LKRSFEALIGRPVVAVSSGTAAIHLGLRLLGVRNGDEVFCSDLTFVAMCNPVRYLGAEPVLLDSDFATWHLDPNVLEDALRKRAERNRLPRALVVAHLYGGCADLDPIMALCQLYGVPVLEDAAEALGAQYRDKPAGASAISESIRSMGTRSSRRLEEAFSSRQIPRGLRRRASGRSRRVTVAGIINTPNSAITTDSAMFSRALHGGSFRC